MVNAGTLKPYFLAKKVFLSKRRFGCLSMQYGEIKQFVCFLRNLKQKYVSDDEEEMKKVCLIY